MIGGKRQGAGRKYGSTTVVGGRARCRAVVDDKNRWEKFLNAIDADLSAGKTESFLRCFEHGYGRPPQALDLNFGAPGGDAQTIEYTVKLQTGAALPAAATGLPASHAHVGGTD